MDVAIANGAYRQHGIHPFDQVRSATIGDFTNSVEIFIK